MVDPDDAKLDQQTNPRISLVVGVYNALNIGVGKALPILGSLWQTAGLFAGQSKSPVLRD